MAFLLRYALFLMWVGCVSPTYEDCTLTCSTENTCPSGLLCDASGWCRIGSGGPVCALQPVCQTSTQCAPSHTCVDGACHADCDPVANSGCAADQTCLLSFRTDVVWTDCVAAGARARNEACAQDSECGRALFCPADVCTPYCLRMAHDPCGGGFKCQELAPGDVKLRDMKIGFCHPD